MERKQFFRSFFGTLLIFILFEIGILSALKNEIYFKIFGYLVVWISFVIQHIINYKYKILQNERQN